MCLTHNFFLHSDFRLLPSAFIVLHFHLPAVDAMQMDVHLPRPCSRRESEQRDQVELFRDHRNNALQWLAGDRHISSCPEAHRTDQAQHTSHGLNIKAGQQVPARKPCETGGHSARGAGQSRADQKSAFLQPQLPMRSMSIRRGRQPSCHDKQAQADARKNQSQQSSANRQSP
jgi:hypothetical protein